MNSNMDQFETFLKNIGPLIRATEAKPEPTPPEMVAALDAAILGKVQQPRILTEAQMRVEILTLLSKTPLDSYSLLRKLKEENLSLAEEGSLFIYGILYKLEETGLLKTRRNVTAADDVTTYHVTEEGSESLKKEKSFCTVPLSQAIE